MNYLKQVMAHRHLFIAFSTNSLKHAALNRVKFRLDTKHHCSGYAIYIEYLNIQSMFYNRSPICDASQNGPLNSFSYEL